MTGTGLVQVQDVTLPQVSEHVAPMLQALTNALGVSRNILPSDEQIGHAWANLPRLISRIPPELRDEGLIRMCVAVASGLFDSGINYAWNAAIIELRKKVDRFGIHLIRQITGKEFDKNKLLDLKDSELLSLCLSLNLISEHGYFMLDQCRDIRNNFSSAHPTIGTLDEDEFINFVNRVGRYALNNEQNPQAVDIQGLMESINIGSFSEEQYRVWCERIENTFEAQREAIFGMLHGIYCDPSKGQESRVNSVTIFFRLKNKITPSIASTLINRHQDYQAKAEVERHKASQAFFENLGLLDLLSDAEKHAIISTAAKKLLSVHNAFDNFDTEPPFAERLRNLTENQAIPTTVQAEFVETVVTCSVGNPYGTSAAADVHYNHIIQSFSPREIQIMLDLPETKSVVSSRIKTHTRCKKKFSNLVDLLNRKSIPTVSKQSFDKWMLVCLEDIL
ncbi:MAG: hypothetical protein PHD48_10930 [Alphaproteobacteria bacterium]|nr:hypothetical protein [Alphaproteobacteria bacterium]